MNDIYLPNLFTVSALWRNNWGLKPIEKGKIIWMNKKHGYLFWCFYYHYCYCQYYFASYWAYLHTTSFRWTWHVLANCSWCPPAYFVRFVSGNISFNLIGGGGSQTYQMLIYGPAPFSWRDSPEVVRFLISSSESHAVAKLGAFFLAVVPG